MLRTRIFLSKPKNYINCLSNRRNHDLTEYNNKAEYPPILDISYKANVIRKAEKWYAEISDLPTVEQKLIELNMPKYYGWWSAQVYDNDMPLAGGDFIQYATRTHVEKTLPKEYYSEVQEEASNYLSDAVDLFENVVDIHFNSSIHRRKKTKVPEEEVNQETSISFINTLNNYLCALTASNNSHIAEVQVDHHPRIEAFWFLGGFDWNEFEKRRFKTVTEALDYSTRTVQSYASPTLRLRTKDGLPQVKSREDSQQYADQIPISRVDSRNAFYYTKLTHARINPGFWPGVNKEQSHLFYHQYKDVIRMGEKFGPTYDADTIIQRKLVTAGFSQALAQSMWLGFGPVTELEYPIVQQSIITDGKKISFALYQLNTTKLYYEHGYNNPLTNMLWVTPETQLYDRIENGRVKGLNEEALKQLISMYLKKPVPRVNDTPYLAPYKHVSGFDASEGYRNDFFKTVLHLSGTRNRNLVIPTVYWWEYIYKMKFRRRHMDAKYRWFVTNNIHSPREMEPRKRRLDDHLAVYQRRRYAEDRAIPSVRHRPRINSKRLFKYDHVVLKRSLLKDHPDWLD